MKYSSSHYFKKIYFTLNCVYVRGHGVMSAEVAHGGQKRATDFLGLKFKGPVSSLM